MVSRRSGAQKDDIFFRIRDGSLESVLRELEKGIQHPDGASAKYVHLDQGLMFFAAARKRERGGSERVARRLHALGVPTDTVDSCWQTPLFYAAREGNLDCAIFLMEHGCGVDRLDLNCQSAVFYSLREGHREMTQLLINYGASLELRDNKGNTPLDYERRTKPSGSIKTQSTHGAVEGGVLEDEDDGLEMSRAAAKKSGSVKRRRLATKVDDSRMAQSTKAKAAADASEDHQLQTFKEAMAAWAAGLPPRRNPASKAIVQPPLPGPSEPRLLKDSQVLARAGGYAVCLPVDGDVERLRELEREFVVDHADMLQAESWHGHQTPADWCALVNVILEEGASHQAIRSIARGQTLGHSTLACVQLRGVNVVSKIVGYVHVFRDGDCLDVSHLKVERAHQGKGLGGLLIAGAVRMALQDEWDLKKLRLVVLEKNVRAVQLYAKLGFADTSTLQKRVRTGSAATVAWLHMFRVMHETTETFAAACEDRVRS